MEAECKLLHTVQASGVISLGFAVAGSGFQGSKCNNSLLRAFGFEGFSLAFRGVVDPSYFSPNPAVVVASQAQPTKIFLSA